MQADRLLNTPAPLVDNKHTTHSPQFKTITASAAARLPSLNMPPKHPAMSPSIATKTRKSYSRSEARYYSQTREARKLIALLATMA
ncbi:hypothetical protein E2C01_075628 [Portunus trituberculatus]|uniref:Uncharacterized protein n=1 Tax=Portunus trituberculatus TaxID=210409 RepID=A0A5B7IJM5_PORTR|nr:hypothetical protein [Portunus trituberculatus]